MAEYTSDGRMEIPDPTPVELPLGFRRPESLADMIRRMVRTEFSVQAEAEGKETFEEADDFDLDTDDDAPLSVYQKLPEAKSEGFGYPLEAPLKAAEGVKKGSEVSTPPEVVKTPPDGSKGP